MTNVPYIVYELECRHKVSGPASYVNGKLHCPWCHDENQIKDVVVNEWRANCQNCRYSRWAGMSEANAEVLANGHVRRNPKHGVKVELAANLQAKITKDKLDAWRVLSES